MRHPRRGARAALILLPLVLVAGTARLSPQAASAQGGGTIGYGSKLFGRLTADTPELAYSFSGTAGDLVEIRARNWVGTVRPAATLLAPDGQTLAASNPDPFAPDPQDATLALVLPQTGVYLLLVSAEAGTSGEFLLTLQGRGPMPSTPLFYGQGVEVAVSLNPQPLYLAFDAQDCPTILTVTNLSEGRPFTFPYAVKVRNEQGRVIALLLGGDALEDRLVVAPLSGRYEVEVLSEDPAQAGTVHLLVSCADQAPGCLGTDGGAPPATGEACPTCFDEETCAGFEVSVSHGGDTTYTFTWPPVEGAAQYVFRVLDASGALLEDSAIALEGVTRHTYTLPLDALGRGPFTAVVSAGPAPDGGYLCLDETPFTADDVPTPCNLTVAAHVVPGAPRVAVVEWTPIPDAAAYLIHVYAYSDDGGLIGIRVLTVPGDTATYHLSDIFPAAYARFQLKVGAYSEATGGGAFADMPRGFLCSGTTDVTFEPVDPLDRGPVEWGPAVED